eukprot:TRINITY_DN11574_c0_g1_i3.p1 TRINITY_DN11574_c0_g1~~TRINITY_DN11574_c0_g1_i3.p1  ORF type:complete len:1082 (+),score=338.30 TRINITY_DN11574_c0_g1_i3:1264-4509(+)
MSSYETPRLHGASPASVASTAAKGKAELLQLAVNESKGEIQSLRVNVGTLQESISGHARALQHYKSQLRDREDENRSLHQATHLLKAELQDARRGKDDTERQQHKYTQLTQQLQLELDEERMRSTRQREELESTTERCRAAELTLEELRRSHAQLAEELARTQDLHRRLGSEGSLRENELQRTAVHVTQQFEDTCAELREMKTRCTEYQIALQERERELQALQERSRHQGLEALQGQEELGKLRRSLAEEAAQAQAMTERVANLEHTRRQLEGELDKWCAKHDEAARRTEDLSRQLEDRVSEIERMQRAVHGKEDEIEELRERGRFHSSQIGEHESSIRSLEKQLQERVEHISYLEAKLAGQTKELFERSSKCDELNRERTSLIQQIEKLNADLDDAHAEILRIREEANAVRDQGRADLEEQRRLASVTKGELSQARAKIAQQEGKLATVEDIKADLQSQLRDVETQNAQYQARLAEQRKELSEWGAVIVKLQGEKEDALNHSDSLEQERAALHAQITRLQAKSMEYREDLRLTKEDLQAQQDLGSRRDQELDQLRRALEDKHLHIITLDEKYERHNQTIAEKMREIRSLQQQLEDERNQVSQAGIEMSRLEGRIGAKEDEAAALKEKNMHLKDQLMRQEQQTRRLESLPSVIETQEAELDRLRNTLKRLEDDQQNYIRVNQGLQQRLNEKENAYESAHLKLNDLAMELQHVAKGRDELENQISDKAQETIRLKGVIARLEGKVDAMDDAQRQWESKYSEAEAEKEDVRRALDHAIEEKNHLIKELNAMRTKSETLEGTRNDAERQVNEASLSLLKAREEAEALRDANTMLSAEVQHLRQLTHLPQLLEAKEQEIMRLQDSMHMLEKQAGTNANAVRDLSGRSTELETVLVEKDRELAELKRSLQRKTQDAEQAMNEVLTKTNEISRLKSSLARLEGRFQVMSEASEGEKGKAAMLEDELRQLRAADGLMAPPSSRWRSDSGLAKKSPRRDRSPSPGKEPPISSYRRTSATMQPVTVRQISPLKREDAAPTTSPRRNSRPHTPTSFSMLPSGVSVSKVPYTPRGATPIGTPRSSYSLRNYA